MTIHLYHKGQIWLWTTSANISHYTTLYHKEQILTLPICHMAQHLYHKRLIRTISANLSQSTSSILHRADMNYVKPIRAYHMAKHMLHKGELGSISANLPHSKHLCHRRQIDIWAMSANWSHSKIYFFHKRQIRAISANLSHSKRSSSQGELWSM